MRFGTLSLGLGLLLAGCEQDILISDFGKAAGVPNPPALESPVKVDTIVQVTTPEVDVLWVIDDSCSMLEEQRLLRDNFSSFMEFFLDSGLDWHVGVVSTDTSHQNRSGKLVQAGGLRYLDPETPDPVALFGQMAVLGTNGDPDERGRRAAYKALTDPLLSGTNAGFYRSEASLNVIVISDEDDFSNSNPSRNEFIDFLLGLKRDPETVTFSSIVGPTGGCVTADAGTDYIVVTNAVGGIHESICTEDWSPILEQLGLQAAGLKREYFLSEVPVLGTIEVWVEDEDLIFTGVWTEDYLAASDPNSLCPATSETCFQFDYDQYRNSIIMTGFIPSPLAEINIEYELLSGYVPSAGDEASDTGE